MVVLTVKAGRKKAAAAVILLLVIIGGLFGIRGISSYIKEKEAREQLFAGVTAEDRLAFLGRFGIEPEDGEQSESIRIPAVFGEEYLRYNELQKECGMDLSFYKGKEAVLYTYPLDEEKLSARLIVWEGKVIGGDVLSEKGEGEVHGLARYQAQETMLPRWDDPAWPTD